MVLGHCPCQNWIFCLIEDSVTTKNKSNFFINANLYLWTSKANLKTSQILPPNYGVSNFLLCWIFNFDWKLKKFCCKCKIIFWCHDANIEIFLKLPPTYWYSLIQIFCSIEYSILITNTRYFITNTNHIHGWRGKPWNYPEIIPYIKDSYKWFQWTALA